MTRTTWTDVRKPSPGDAIWRDDDRVCRVKGYKALAPYNPSSKGGQGIRMGSLGAAELPPTPAGDLLDYPPVITECGEEIPPRIVSMNVFWPAVSQDALTCLKCMGAK